MSYSELIKNFERVRDYMREFYVCGFKSREEYDKKSARSYDDERRRIESWLGDYMGFRRTKEGKNIFLSIDSRFSHHNPLYRAWKAKSFTDGDITLYFLIFDIFSSAEAVYSLSEIINRLDCYLADFCAEKTFDASNIRKKLKEYAKEGLICTAKQGKTLAYRRAEPAGFSNGSALNFFSEVAPCGVIGSFLLDQWDMGEEYFIFKHHYITQALDSDILCPIFEAMGKRREVRLSIVGRHTAKIVEKTAVPLRIFISVQNGRQYLLGYSLEQKQILSFRIDRILMVKEGESFPEFDRLRAKLDRMQKNMWGVSTQKVVADPVSLANCADRNKENADGEEGFFSDKEQRDIEHLERVEFIIKYHDGEEYIHHRLVREKRCGQVERLSAHRSRFVAVVYDSSELIPWIRTFICRIVSLDFSNRILEERFRTDLQAMYQMYGIPEKMVEEK